MGTKNCVRIVLLLSVAVSLIVGGAPAGAEPSLVLDPPANTGYDVFLTAVGADQDAVIRVIRTLRNDLDPRGATTLTDRVPWASVLTQVSKAEAERAEAMLERRGASVCTFVSSEDPSVDEKDRSFLMPVEDVFVISGRGPVVTGRIERGSVRPGDEVEIVGLQDTHLVSVTGLESFRRALDLAEAGDNIGVSLRGVERAELERGQVLAEPGSIKPHTQFQAKVCLFESALGGPNRPVRNGYESQLHIRTVEIPATAHLPESISRAIPGDDVNLTMKLSVPIALEQGTTFTMREGERTVGAGQVIRLLDAEERYDVILVSAGRHPNTVANTLRALRSDLRARDIRTLIIRTPSTVLEGVTEEEADTAQSRLERAGATVTKVREDRFSVVLTWVGANSREVSRIIADLVRDSDSAPQKLAFSSIRSKMPSTVLQGITREEAETAQATLEAAGATAILTTQETVPPPPWLKFKRPFLMSIERTQKASRRLMAVFGRVEHGMVRAGDKVEIVGPWETHIHTVVDLRKGRTALDFAQAGETIGIYFGGADPEDAEEAQILARPGSVASHTAFQGVLYVLTEDEGGGGTRSLDGRRIRFNIWDNTMRGSIRLPEGVEEVSIGEPVLLDVELGEPVAFTEGSRFTVSEGARSLGVGWITKVKPDTRPPVVELYRDPRRPNSLEEVSLVAEAKDEGEIVRLVIVVDGEQKESCTEDRCVTSVGPFPVGWVNVTATAYDDARNLSTDEMSFRVIPPPK